MTKMSEIRNMKDAELAELVKKQREQLRSFRFGTGGQDVSAVRRARKEIARALTELTARQASAGRDASVN